MWPFSIEETSSIYNYASIATILAGIITTASGAIVYISSNVLSSDTNLKITNAQTVGAKANETAAIANKQTEEIKKQNIELSLNLEIEKNNRIKLEQALGARTLDQSSRQKIEAAALKIKINRTIIIQTSSNEAEVIAYAKQIHQALITQKIKAELRLGGTINHGQTGVGANIFPGEDSHAIEALLVQTNIATQLSTASNPNLTVGALVTIYSKPSHL